MTRFRTYMGTTLFFLGMFITILLIPIFKLPFFVVYICFALVIAGSIIREGHPLTMIRNGIIILFLFTACVWVTMIIIAMIIVSFRSAFSPEIGTAKVVLSIYTTIMVIEGIIFMFFHILWCLNWVGYNTQEKKLKIKTKKRKKTKKSNILPSSLNDQIQSTIKSKDIKEKSEQIKKEYPSVEIDIKAKSIKKERIRRANDYNYQFNGQFVNQLLKNAGITKETPEAEAFMREWDRAEAKRRLTKVYFCPYCLTKVKEKNEQPDGEYFCSWCNIKTQKKKLIIEEKIEEKIIY